MVTADAHQYIFSDSFALHSSLSNILVWLQVISAFHSVDPRVLCLIFGSLRKQSAVMCLWEAFQFSW